MSRKLFGTDGIRGKANVYPMTAEVAMQMGKAIGYQLRSEEKPKVVFSCGSGITACVLALAATLCNYNNLIVYDGSWTEYGSLTDT